MKRWGLLCLMILLLGVLAGCESDNGVVETNDEFVPYWWRDDPFYDDKDVDEEATIALGDPNVVVMMSEPREPVDIMLDKIAAKISEEFGEEHVMHVLLHDLDKVKTWNIPDVNMDLVEEKVEPLPNVVDECDACPFVTHELDCDDGGGGSPPPPPPPPTPAVFIIKLYVNSCLNGDECLTQRTNLYSGEIYTEALATIQMLNTRVERNGYAIYVPDPYLTKWLAYSNIHTKIWSIAGPYEPWQASYTGKVTYHISPSEEQPKLVQKMM